MQDILAEVSDEIGEEDLGDGYLLKYKGWDGACIDEIWNSFEEEQEREDASYQYAEDQSYIIISNEWKPELKHRGYTFIDGGYDSGGLYGRTWALFKKKS